MAAGQPCSAGRAVSACGIALHLASRRHRIPRLRIGMVRRINFKRLGLRLFAAGALIVDLAGRNAGRQCAARFLEVVRFLGERASNGGDLGDVGVTRPTVEDVVYGIGRIFRQVSRRGRVLLIGHLLRADNAAGFIQELNKVGFLLPVRRVASVAGLSGEAQRFRGRRSVRSCPAFEVIARFGRVVQSDRVLDGVGRRVRGRDRAAVQAVADRVCDRRIGHRPGQRGARDIFVGQGRRIGRGVGVAGIGVGGSRHVLTVRIRFRVGSKCFSAAALVVDCRRTGGADKAVLRSVQLTLCCVDFRLSGFRIAEHFASVLQLRVVGAPRAAGVVRLHVGTDAGIDQRAQVRLADGGDLQQNHRAGDRVGRYITARSAATEIMDRGSAGTGNRNADRVQILFADVVGAAVNVAARCVIAKLRHRIAAAFPQHGAVGILVRTIDFFHFAVASPIGVLQNIS